MKIYLDNSATSWPKPPAVVEAISDYLTNFGASPGRSGHQFAVKAAREVFETRDLVAQLFNVPSSDRVIFTANSTHALNIAINGILKQGDHVITTTMEHNSVNRPLKFLEDKGVIEVSRVPCSEMGNIDIDEFQSSFRPNTRMVIVIHGSNVSGSIMPIKHIGKVCKEKGVLFMVDAAQTAGFIPIDMINDNIDILSITGHKKLYGPPGIGALCIRDEFLISPLVRGGSGSKSEMDVHPDFYPDRLEAGTPNTVGIVGLKAGIKYILSKGIDNIRNSQIELTARLISELKRFDNVIVYGPEVGEERLPVVSININEMPPSELAMSLDSRYGIMVRAGLHCAPLAHKSIGTFPQGTVRFSLGCFSSAQDIDLAIEAIKQISNEWLSKKN
jgi:cysteine desulfurase family protein